MPKKNNKDTFIKKSNLIHNFNYNYSKVDYINNSTNVIIICNIHGEFIQRPDVHLRGCGCIKCGYIKNSKNNRLKSVEFLKKCRLIHKDNYDYSDVVYINNRTPIDIICKVHGSFKQEPRSHLRGSGCPNCANKNIDSVVFIEKCKLIYGDHYNYDKVKYISSIKKVLVKCKKGHEFKITPNNHLRGRGCPICRQSRGEIIISKYLLDQKIEFISQYRFNDCKLVRPLPFDFYLPKYKICIEFDGEQHFNKFRFETDDSNLEKRKIKDNVKNEYCKMKNIFLLRIKYNEDIISKLNSLTKDLIFCQ